MASIALVKPSLVELPGYAAALSTGWSPHNLRQAEAAREHLAKIAVDATGFVASLDDPDARGEPITLPDGSRVARLPGITRWMWDGTFCGSIALRWQHGIETLPAHVLGHIGFGVVPWKRGSGFARQALALMLPLARLRGLPYVELTTNPSNLASQRVILACGGRLLERFAKLAVYGGGDELRFRIDLPDNPEAP